MRGFLYFLLGLFAWVPILFYAIRGKYPYELNTPDDPFFQGKDVPHFGHYEESVRRVYRYFGRYVGDVYWLGFRNTLFGLKYKHKIPGLIGLVDYSHLITNKQLLAYKHFSIAKYELFLDGKIYKQHTIRLFGLFCMFGHKIDSVHNDKKTIRQPVNMEGRPFFTFRTRRTS